MSTLSTGKPLKPLLPMEYSPILVNLAQWYREGMLFGLR